MDIRAAFRERFGCEPKVWTRAPGRVNLLGEHVDYNEGVVLPAAIDRAVYLAATPLQDQRVELYALDLNKNVAFSLDQLKERIDVVGKTLPNWGRYPAGVAWALQGAGLQVSGLKAVYTSDVPIGAGLSSSAAVEVAFAATWRLLGGWDANCLEIARLCQKAENGYVGVNCGLMDQFASACGLEGHALYFDTRSLEYRPVRLPVGTAIVIADSGVRRSLAGSAYNERRAACEKAVELLQAYKPGIHSLRDISTVEFAAYSLYLPEEVSQRAEHVVKEIHRVGQAVNALKAEDAQLFGGLMFAGHKSLRDLYEVSIPELDALVEIARGLPGIYGARLSGAGFGGCTVNLIEEVHAEEFIWGLKDGYRQKTGHEAQVYLCHASAGVQSKYL
ncbi:MAG: galactokinase [Anaerolineales bacterium]|nr:galactokinase [Anaerolineales bacterium]